MTDELLHALTSAREQRQPCVLVTVAATQGSVPRHAGAKMLVFATAPTVGTIGGGKFEALVLDAARAALGAKEPVLKTYPLHGDAADSFGAVCGGAVTVLIEPQAAGEALFIFGAGHCARAIAQLARGCGWQVTVIDDRAELLEDFPVAERRTTAPADFIASRSWTVDDVLVLVSRNYELDREALHAALQIGELGYLGMMGSRRKVREVFAELTARGATREQLARVFAPLGLDIGADAPEEIAISVLAEILQVLRARPGHSLRQSLSHP